MLIGLFYGIWIAAIVIQFVKGHAVLASIDMAIFASMQLVLALAKDVSKLAFWVRRIGITYCTKDKSVWEENQDGCI